MDRGLIDRAVYNNSMYHDDYVLDERACAARPDHTVMWFVLEG